MKMVSVVTVMPLQDKVDVIVELVTESRKGGIAGLETYSIVHSREGELVFINQWASLDVFVDYLSSPHNMIELIEVDCNRYDAENVSKAYSGPILHQQHFN